MKNDGQPSLKTNGQFYNDYEDKCYITCLVSIVLTITYIGSIYIGDKIIIREKINNPYQDLSQRVTTESDKNKYYRNCLKVINSWFNYILSCFGVQPLMASDNNSQDKLDITKMKYNQFWKQTIEEKLKEAEYLVDKIIEQKYGLEASNSLNIEEYFQRLSIEQQYNLPGTCNINNDSDLSDQSVQDDSKYSLVLPKKEDNPLKFRSPMFNRYRYN